MNSARERIAALRIQASCTFPFWEARKCKAFNLSLHSFQHFLRNVLVRKRESQQKQERAAAKIQVITPTA